MADNSLELRFHPVTVGRNATIRVADERGGGLPGDPRTRDGELKPHGHKGGLDICAHAGHHILSPIDGLVKPLKAAEPALRGVHIVGTGRWKGYDVKLVHVLPLDRTSVSAGEPIGAALNITSRYPGITNHIHLQAKKDGRWLNPLGMFGWFKDAPTWIPEEWAK